ncbi:hypothetical protein NLM31_30285 [Bradyrhizobium sp. CCGUVB4N]|uniref:hypothetical protein n=1 Tax=Bradyrhizobium sp. CCGUVB4N TaxID=2949631 RepID=UPI0020B2475A|nr:hypothetical protein [Bradyrhizobium sp. CCGUVB4N]MCP3384670.1 hypothetical protein [Bradyrhizobium sp. CCGUVB4N]
MKAEPLGEDYAAAVERAEYILLPAFDSWRSRGLTDLVPLGITPGSFDWLAGVFKAHQKFREIDHKTRRLYEQGLALFSDHLLKDGTRAGSKQIDDFTKGFVDAVYAKLLIVEEQGADGNVVRRERRRFANAAMTACRRAWFVGQRAEEKRVPAVNPFSKMGLKTRAPGQPIRETPTATWDELVAFRVKASELGYRSVATAALVAWEWLQREEHVFGAFEIRHYRPKERPNSVRIVHPKNGEEAWWPLFDENGETLFPELMTELDEIKQVYVSGLVFRRDHKHRRSPNPLPWITARRDLRYLRGVVKKVVRAAGLREELSFTSFRHGGFTEGADSDLTDSELRTASRHRSLRQLPTYAKRTRKQLISGTKKRREERTKVTSPSDASLLE